MTKVLLINPPGTFQDGFTNPPLGLLYIAGTLRANNIEVKIVDGCIKGWDGIHQALITYKPDIAGITCLTPQRKKALQAAQLAKDCNPNILTIIGGAHPTIMYKQLLENYPFVDLVILGEGEQSMLKIAKGRKQSAKKLHSSLSKINGIAYRESKDIIKTGNGENVKNLDSLPFPTWDVVEFDKYVKWGKGIKNGINLEKEPRISVVFSRGCKGHCDFCSSWWIWKKWRHRSPANMVDELELLNNKYGIRHINFADDTMTVNREATIELCKEIMKRKLKIAFLLSTRGDCVDPEMLCFLKQAGCYKIAYGVESGSQTILNKLGKETDIETTKKALIQTKQAGIETCALIIVGNQGESAETVNETIDFLNETNPTEVGSVGGLWVLPGTKLYRHCKEQGAIDDSFWLGDEPYMLYTLEHSREEIERFHKAIQERKKLPVTKVLPQNAIPQRQVFSHRWQRYLQHDKNEYSATTEWVDAQKLHIELMQQILPDCKDILDLGCGDGWSVNTLKNKGKNAVGLSCNLKEIEHAKKTYNLDIVYGDMHELPFDDYSFDCIYSRESYEHSIAPYIAMCEMNRVLKLNGFILINVPDEKWIREDSHFSVLTPAQMEEMFYKCKFELIRNGMSSANHYWYLAQKKGDLEVNAHSRTVPTDLCKSDRLSKIVCMMRIKNEEEWIAETLTEISKIADAIVILDDGSTDKTPEICKSFPKVVRYEYQSEQMIDEVRDKNKLLRWVLELKPDWILAMDGDEVLESKAKEKIMKEIANCPPEVSALEFEFLYFWDTKKRYRVDGKYSKLFHPRLFKLANQIVENLTFTPTEHGSNFHGGSAPNNLVGQSKKTFIRVKHYGYLYHSDRKKKYDWYCANDPVNAKKGYYKHLISEKGMILVDWNEDEAIPCKGEQAPAKQTPEIPSTLNVPPLQELERGIVDQFHKLYHDAYIFGGTWKNTFWLGIPTYKCPLDLWIYQEIIFEVKPDVIIECGTANGGSALFMASMCDLVSNGKIITIDIESKEDRPKHKRITYLTGSSTSEEIVEKLKSLIKNEDKIVVILDSDHSKQHVLNELRIYSKFVTGGSYLIVEDTNINGHPASPDFGPGPMEATEEFLKENKDFAVDEDKEKFYLTFNPRGYLRKKNDAIIANTPNVRNLTVINNSAPLAPSIPQKQSYYYANARPEIVELIPSNAKQILDVGCGYGAMGELIKKKIPGCKVTGIEINQEVAQIAAQRLDHVIVGDVEHLEVNGQFGRFDCIIFADVLEHLVNPWSVLKRFSALLSDNGIVIASIPNVRNLTVINNLITGKWSYQEHGILDETHLRFFTRHEIEKMFTNCGYEISKLLPVHDPSLGKQTPTQTLPPGGGGKGGGKPINIDLDRLVIKHVSNNELDELTAIQFLVVAVKKGEAMKKTTFVSPASNVKTGLATSIMSRGNTLVSMGRLDEAIKEFEKLVNLHPDYSEGYVSLACAYYKSGDLNVAEKYFKKAIDLDASNITAMKNLAPLYFDRKDYGKAISTCEAILVKDCKDVDILMLLSNCYFEMNAYEAALIGYQKALELSPKHKDAKKGLVLVKARLKTKEKLKSFGSFNQHGRQRTLCSLNQRGKTSLSTSIIIPTYNKVEYTKQCLTSLLENTDYENYEVIVVDNASTDGTKDFLRTFNGSINIIANNSNLGFSRACNQGAKIATGKYLVFLNNDTTLHPGWLTEMVKLVETDERIAIVGNKQIYPTQNPTLGGMIWHAGVVINENKVSQCIYNGYDQNHPFVNKTREFPAVAGSCMLVRKDVFEKLNGFDEIYLNSHEDIDFCLRVREAGYKVMYCHKSVIEHRVSASEGRHDNESRNAEIFRQRWAQRLEQDDRKYYQEDAREFLDSCKLRSSPARSSGLPSMPCIGFLSTYNQKCGLATYAQQLLAHYDHSKVLIFAEHGKDLLPEPDPKNLIRCWTRNSPDYHFIVELVRKHNVPLIHINNQRGLLSEPLVGFIRHLYQDGRRIIVTFHSTAIFSKDERECFKFIDKAIVHTPENKLELVAQGCDEKKIVVIPHGVPEAMPVDRYTARQKLNLSALGGSNIIASFGFVQESKGIHEIIEAVARLKANGVSVKYFILGTFHPHSQDSKTYLEKCKALALRLGIANLVVFKDSYLPDNTVLQYLQASDAVVMNYKSNTYESSGAAAFALSACRPIITSTAPMFSTFGDACFHMDETCPPELAIFNVLNNPFLRNYLQRNASKYIEENNWKKIAEKHIRLYNDVLSKGGKTSINLIECYNGHPDSIYDEDFQRERIDWLKSRVKGRILEVGCATGFVSEHVGAFSAMDINEGRLAVSSRLRKSCRFIKADATAGMPFKDKSFDSVILAEVLEHVPFDKAKTMLSEAIRVGKNLLVTIPYDGEVKHEELSNNIEHFWLGNEENIQELFLTVSNIKPKIEFSSKRDFILIAQKVDSVMPWVSSIRKSEKKLVIPATTKGNKNTDQDSAARQSIHWVGGFFGFDGYSSAARNYVLGLSEIGVDVSTEPLFDGCPITKES